MFSMNDMILCLGGTGHLGTALIYHLIEDLKVLPEQIRVFYLEGTPTDSLKDIQGLEMFPGNILNRESVALAMADINYVFHMVGNTSFDPANKRIQWLVNVEGTRNVLDACKNSKTVKRMVYTSSVNARGAPDPPGSIAGFRNSDPYTNPIRLHSFTSREQALTFVDRVHKNPHEKWEKDIGICYFDSKLAAQELVNKCVHDHNLDIVSVLPGTMFGPYDHFLNGGMYLVTLYQGKLPGVLPGGSPLVYVKDVAKGHVLAMEKGKKGEEYIMTGPLEDNKTLLQMSKDIVSVLRNKEPTMDFKIPKRVFKPKVANVGAKFVELYSKVFDKPAILSQDQIFAGSQKLWYKSTKAIEELGYNPKTTFKEAIAEMYDYYKDHGLLSATTRFVDKRK